MINHLLSIENIIFWQTVALQTKLQSAEQCQPYKEESYKQE